PPALPPISGPEYPDDARSQRKPHSHYVTRDFSVAKIPGFPYVRVHDIEYDVFTLILESTYRRFERNPVLHPIGEIFLRIPLEVRLHNIPHFIWINTHIFV